jgi:hypothetical protein
MYIRLTLEQYNECTPYELSVMMEQYNKREEDKYDRSCRQAWLIAKLTTPKVPSYESIFKKKNTANDVTHEGLAKNKMHKKQIERHLEEWKKGGLQNGKFRNIRN